MIQRIKNRIISPQKTLLDAMRLMDVEKVKSLFVFEGEHFTGLLTIGDIQRAIIHHFSLDELILRILNNNKIFGFLSDSEEIIREKMLKLRAEVMPILDADGELVDVWFWSDLSKKPNSQREKISLPVVIMAGGQGTRLKPLTNVIPKPLVPIGEKTILEEILNQFESIGCNRFFMSLNYKSDMMRFYLNSLEHKYNIQFFEEPKPLGTIGSVSLLKGQIDTPFFVSNCDILIDQDYRDVWDYHQENRNDITIVTAVKSFKIPYGVVESGEDGLMVALKEKPENTYLINTGVYLISPNCIDDIPSGEFFHVTQLIQVVKEKGGRVGCFPVSENAWRDMGEWHEYLKLINVL